MYSKSEKVLPKLIFFRATKFIKDHSYLKAALGSFLSGLKQAINVIAFIWHMSKRRWLCVLASSGKQDRECHVLQQNEA